MSAISPPGQKGKGGSSWDISGTNSHSETESFGGSCHCLQASNSGRAVLDMLSVARKFPVSASLIVERSGVQSRRFPFIEFPWLGGFVMGHPSVGLFCSWIQPSPTLVPFSLHKLNVDSFIHTSIQCYLPVPITPGLHPVFPTYPVPVYGHRTCGRCFQEPTSLEKPHAHQGGGVDTGTVRNRDEGKPSGFSESNLLRHQLDGTYQGVGRNMTSRQHGRITDMYGQEGT